MAHLSGTPRTATMGRFGPYHEPERPSALGVFGTPERPDPGLPLTVNDPGRNQHHRERPLWDRKADVRLCAGKVGKRPGGFVTL